LAIEELAKLHAVDGLLFARAGDHKDEAFREASKSHYAKLAIFELFPLLLGEPARVHPKHVDDQAFNITVATSIQALKQDGNIVMNALERAPLRASTV
jgi:hypothetical protein